MNSDGKQNPHFVNEYPANVRLLKLCALMVVIFLSTNVVINSVRYDVTERGIDILSVSSKYTKRILKFVKNQHNALKPQNDQRQLSFFYHPNNGSKELVLDLPRCKIPEVYVFDQKEPYSLADCGVRKINIDKISERKARFRFIENVENCCYRYVMQSIDGYKSNTINNIIYSPCFKFVNGTEIHVIHEVLRVDCRNYTDFYSFVLRQNIPQSSNKSHWNVLILGIDSLSRSRAYTEIRRTINYLNDNKWLDFHGYNKMGKNTFPNLIPMLTNYSSSAFKNKCLKAVEFCKDVLIWNKYQDAGYVTAFVEEGAYMKSLFDDGAYINTLLADYKPTPKTHYIKSLFVDGGPKSQKDEITCSGKKTDPEQLLDYALDFVTTYREDKFFGFFWMNTLSHDIIHSAKPFDMKILEFLQSLENMTKNTFIFLLSDHGKTYGPVMKSIESYYTSRLPLFFMKTPDDFKEQFPNEFESLQTNQHRLISSPDIHLTLHEIFDIHHASNDNFKHHSVCDKCKSLFAEISVDRTCADAGIREEFCTCHDVIQGWHNKSDDAIVLKEVRKALSLKVKAIKTTKKCQFCLDLEMSFIQRVHYYQLNGYIYYILKVKFKSAYLHERTTLGYEVVVKIDGDNIKVLSFLPTMPLHENTSDFCCEGLDCFYCICHNDSVCLHRENAKTEGFHE